MRDCLFRKGLVSAIILFIITAGVVSGISEKKFKTNDSKIDIKVLEKDKCSLTFYAFDKTEIKQQNTALPKDIVNDISDMLEELKYKILYEPLCDETQALKIEFIEMVDMYGLIPNGLSKEDMILLINPPWLKSVQKIHKITSRTPLLRGLVLNIMRNYVKIDKDNWLSISYEKPSLESAFNIFCNIITGGDGIPIPPFLLPRPRAFFLWSASNGGTQVSSLLTSKKFIALGQQQGFALGFTGFGFSLYADRLVYLVMGYALYCQVNAEVIEYESN